MSDSFLCLDALSFSYPNRDPLFHEASLRIHLNEKIGLWADNGTGKTTFLRILTGLTEPQHMNLQLDGIPVVTEHDFRRLRRQLGFVLQNPDDQLFFPEVLDDVMFGLLNLGCSPAQAYERSLAALTTLGIAPLRHANSAELSGGQKRLVSLATVMAMAPQGILMDEPTAGLDAHSRDLLIQTLGRHCPTRLIVSHDREFLQAVSDRLITITAQHFEPLSWDN